MNQHYDPFDKKKKKSLIDPFLSKNRQDEIERQKIENQVEEDVNSQEQAEKKVPIKGEAWKNKSLNHISQRKEKISPLVSAGFWIRFLSFLIDTIIASAFAKIFASPIIALMGWPNNWIKGGIIGFFYLSYFIVSTKLTDGQSLGKMITGLRIIHKEEEPMSWTTVIIREFFGRLIQNAFPVLYVIVAFTPLKQSVADLLCDTYVVKDDLYSIEKQEPNLFYQYI